MSTTVRAEAGNVVAVCDSGEESKQPTTRDLKNAPTCKTERDALKALNSYLEQEINELLDQYRSGHADMGGLAKRTAQILQTNISEIARYLSINPDVFMLPKKELNRYGGAANTSPSQGQHNQLQTRHSYLLRYLFRFLAKHFMTSENTPDAQSHSTWSGGDKHLEAFVSNVFQNFRLNYVKVGQSQQVVDHPDLWVPVNESVAFLHLSLARRALILPDHELPEVEDPFFDQLVRTKSKYLESDVYQEGQPRRLTVARMHLAEAMHVTRVYLYHPRKKCGRSITDQNDHWGNCVFSPRYEILQEAIGFYLWGDCSALEIVQQGMCDTSSWYRDHEKKMSECSVQDTRTRYDYEPLLDGVCVERKAGPSLHSYKNFIGDYMTIASVRLLEM